MAAKEIVLRIECCGSSCPHYYCYDADADPYPDEGVAFDYEYCKLTHKNIWRPYKVREHAAHVEKVR